MQPFLSVRNPQVTAHCRATYALLDAYARDGGIRFDPFVNEGAASALLMVSDAMEVLGLERWEQVDREAVSATARLTGFQVMLPFMVRAVARFRRWMVATGRAGDAGLEDLERFAEELPSSDGMTGERAQRANRASRRAARSEARRSERRSMN
ncbi:MAG: hypothetical protein U0353_31455 [Sandaracinus sp.]